MLHTLAGNDRLWPRHGSARIIHFGLDKPGARINPSRS